MLARRVARRLRLTSAFYRITWGPWSSVIGRIRDARKRENYLSFYGPFSILLLLAIWAAVMILGFGLVAWGLGLPIRTPGGTARFSDYLYSSGETFFTLGYGDVVPESALGRTLAVLEAGTGFGFLASVIGYLPVLSQAFSRRELNISMLDQRAGSPPTAAELLRRHATDPEHRALTALLHDWERWSAELLESHVSFPVLGFFRSQHDNQSWISSLAAILDACSLVIVGVRGGDPGQARLTFAMARHAVVDMANVYRRAPLAATPDRLPPHELLRLRATLSLAGIALAQGDEADRRLEELRRMYEPQLGALGDFLLMPLPPWMPPGKPKDNWQALI